MKRWWPKKHSLARIRGLDFQVVTWSSLTAIILKIITQQCTQAISATPQGIIELLSNLVVHYEKTIVFFPDLSLLVSTFSRLSSEIFTFLAPLDHWLLERLEPRNNHILTVLEIELNVWCWNDVYFAQYRLTSRSDTWEIQNVPFSLSLDDSESCQKLSWHD